MSGKGQGGAREGSGRRKDSADQLHAAGSSSSTRVAERFDEEFWELWDATPIEIPWGLSDAWELLPQKKATEVEFNYIANILAKRILSGELSTKSPKLFTRWARSVLADAGIAEPVNAAPQPRDARSEKMAEQYRLLAEHEEERKRNGTFRPLESFRAVQNWMKRDPEGYEYYRAMVGTR